MTKKKAKELPHGLYRLIWKEGGHSLASVGSLTNGDRWFAPINWTNETEQNIACVKWRMVKHAILLLPSKY